MFFYSNSDSLICGEKSFIQQCLINLCKNAIEAMENGGILSIRTWDDHDNLYLEIKDSGVGMSEEQLNKLGQPFFTTKGYKGTGLGILATCRILKKLNSTITVSSKKGEGTMFLLSFPLIEKVNQLDIIKNNEFMDAYVS
jgi:two-component system sporulation sensor kinase B